ncbi:TIGR03089 family protein [Gordonia otitidis]|nr:TIGR03089 family protein [Gordonia otitidis]
MSDDTVTTTLLGRVDDWARPLLTYYDDHTGERTELSAATLGNWAAKTANYLLVEVGLVPGDDVVVDLPEHWQSAAILLGSWWAGAHVHVDTESDTARVVFTSAAGIDTHADAEELVVASLDPFGLGVADLPPGVSDYASAVRVHGDQYSPPRYSGAALDGRTTTEVLDSASTLASSAGIGSTNRVLSTREWHTGTGILANLVTPLSTGASLVWVSPTPDTDLASRAASERADLVLE